MKTEMAEKATNGEMMGVMQAEGSGPPIIDPPPYQNDIYPHKLDQAGPYVMGEVADSVEGLLDIQGELSGKIKIRVTNSEESPTSSQQAPQTTHATTSKKMV